MLKTATICDWFACSQTHFGDDIPKHCEGIVTCINSTTGELEWENIKAYQHKGSFDTSIRVKSDGNRVEISGNVGRFGRMDNVFGYGVDDCKIIANNILAQLGLPAFTSGDRFETATKNTDGEYDPNIGYTGAVVSQIHITENYSAGCQADAKDFLYWLTSQKVSRGETTHYKGETVYFGESSKYARTKFYNKAVALRKEMQKLAKRPHHHVDYSEAQNTYVSKLASWADCVGLVRLETEFKTRYLAQNELRNWEKCTSERVQPHYEKYKGSVMKRCEEFADLIDLPARAQDLYHAYMAGENLRDRHNWSSATFYRYRKMLLAVGVDINQTLNVRALRVKPRIIELTPAISPEFYELPDVAVLNKEAA